MKMKIILCVTILLTSTSFLSGCSNNNVSNSKISLTILDFKDGNLTGEEFKNVSMPPEKNKLVYIELKVKNNMDESILTSPYYITIINSEGKTFMHFQASFDLINPFLKNYINPGGSYSGGLIYLLIKEDIPAKLNYFDPINNINMTIPLNT